MSGQPDDRVRLAENLPTRGVVRVTGKLSDVLYDHPKDFKASVEELTVDAGQNNSNGTIPLELDP